LELEKPIIDLQFDDVEDTITLTADKLAKDIYVYVNNYDIQLSDNYFDISGGASKTIKILNCEAKNIKDKVKVISLYDSYQLGN